MERKERKKGPVWKHFNIESKCNDSHPHVRCKYCLKDFKRAVPERMQAHLDKKCPKVPIIAKSQSRQQNTTSRIDKFSDCLNEGEQETLEFLLTKVMYSPPELSNKEEVKMKTDYNDQLISPSDIHYLGKCYLNGKGTEKNEIKAFKLYKQAVERGHIDSINDLGYCYRHGIGTEKSEIKAFELYKEAVEKGHVDSLYNLGQCYENGIGTEKSEVNAFELYKELAGKGITESIHLLGECYYYGIGTEKNEIRAFELYEEAAKKGHVDSLYDLGYCYENGIGTEKNEN